MKRINVQKLRERANMTRAELAQYLGGVSERTVQSWELGTRRPSKPVRQLLERLESGQQ